jgi:hypothetical protein|tara:strand:+ start:325 stop:639 length:315 start_codon:yes stop_codon:yes gene_type:complete
MEKQTLVVLGDGETFSGIEDCEVVVVSEEASNRMMNTMYYELEDEWDKQQRRKKLGLPLEQSEDDEDRLTVKPVYEIYNISELLNYFKQGKNWDGYNLMKKGGE